MNTTRVSPFPATQWTAVVKVCRQGEPAQRVAALDALCRDYWYPLYAFARRLGHRRPEAEDMTQGFFYYLLERDLFASADPALGRLRTFLLTAFQRYINGVRDRENALKRGGGREIFSLDVDAAERRFSEPADTLTPEQIFDRQWALSVLHAALGELFLTESAAGRAEPFRVLEPFLNPEAEAEASYETAALTLKMNEAAVRKAVSRLRAKFRETLRGRIAATLNEPGADQVDEELKALKTALHG